MNTMISLINRRERVKGKGTNGSQPLNTGSNPVGATKLS